MRYPIARWDACIAFAFYRLAVIMQGIGVRLAKGNASQAELTTSGALKLADMMVGFGLAVAGR